MRIGNGYDVHRLVEGRPLIVGGVEIPHSTGLLGHSDGDVLLHALADALLGAAALGDIGGHFPDNDPRYKGISSLLLLEEVGEALGRAGYGIVNLDAVIVAERPKMAPHIPLMKEKIAAALGLETGQISLKASTNEGLGFCGRQEGIAALAVALMEKVSL